jgi:glycosyltransferase involved in cell wall biosynthesis
MAAAGLEKRGGGRGRSVSYRRGRDPERQFAMHLVHAVHRYPPALGGAEKYVGELTDFHRRHGDTVHVWTSTAIDLEAMRYPGREELPPGTADGVTRFRPTQFRGRRYVYKALSQFGCPAWQCRWQPCGPTMPDMLRAADTFDGPLDAVHAFAFPHAFPAYAALRLARRRGVPLLLTPFLHLGDPDDPRDRTRRQYTSLPLRWLLKQADRVFVQTPSELRACLGLGVPRDRLTLQGLGIDVADCAGVKPEFARRTLSGVGTDDIVVGHLANLSREKGTLDLLAASEGLPSRVVLAGPVTTGFLALCPKPPTFKYLGQVNQAQKRRFFAGIDLFVLPSRTDSFGLVLLEAWANGKPVIAYRAGGPADLVRDGVDGLLVKCGDVGALRAAIMRLAGDAELRQRLGEEGRARIPVEFARDERLAVVRDTLAADIGEVAHAPR